MSKNVPNMAICHFEALASHPQSQMVIYLQSLDESASTGTLSPPAPSVISGHTPKEVESLQAELAVKEGELARIKEEVHQGCIEGEELRVEMATLKDKLNVSEVHM